jgi:uncharacterized Rmd1/YagE family protein
MYRKPTYTDTVTPESSNHPNNHKQAAFNYLSDRAHKIPMTDKERDKEMEQINVIATNNGYNISDIKRSYKKKNIISN